MVELSLEYVLVFVHFGWCACFSPAQSTTLVLLFHALCMAFLQLREDFVFLALACLIDIGSHG
jgi:hypothetical protein